MNEKQNKIKIKPFHFYEKVFKKVEKNNEKNIN
jgi:hypothetical protein